MSDSQVASEADLFDVLRTLRRLSTGQVDKGRRFERLMKYAFLRHPGEYGPSRFSNVWLWSEWPDRETFGYGQDIGIDLVAEQTESSGGGLCAIQCKFYDKATVPTSAVNSFLATSNADHFTSRILVATAKLTAPATLKISKASPRCELLQGSDLQSWGVPWRDFLEHPEKLAFDHQRYKPHPYQSEAVEKVVAGFYDHDRGKLILPCGTGKSVVALWIAERVARVGGRVLYLVPSIALMGQTMREWARQRHPDIPHRYFGICSDVKAGRNSEDADLVELAMPVTTDPSSISKRLAERHNQMLTVVFSTYQSLPRVAKAQVAGAPEFDLVICDEAHRTTGIHATGISENRKDGSAFTLIHDDEKIGAERRLYMTATPRIYSRKLKAKAKKHIKDFDIYSMDDINVYGPEFFRLKFGDAVAGGYLSDYRVAVIAVDEESMILPLESVDIGNDRSPVNLKDAVKIAGCWDALADPTTRTTKDRTTGAINHQHVAKRAIAFTNTITSSKRVEQYWNPIVKSIGGSAEISPLLDCHIRHVDGKKNALQRAQILNWLKQGVPEGTCRIVTNAKCLTEGVDVPALDAVVFLEPRRSQIEIVQAVGRVMRRTADKDIGYVVLPVIVKSGSRITDDDVLNSSDFKHVWEVLKALRSHDERVDIWVNTADLGGTTPVTIITKACPGCGDFKCDQGQECPANSDGDTRLRVKEFVQGRLPLENAIASKLVEKCGDRQYWKRWAQSVSDIADRITVRINTLIEAESGLDIAFQEFLTAMRATIGEHVTSTELVAMLAQHLVTLPVFDALFVGSAFADLNPISKALNELLDEFKASDHRLADETRDLERFYDSVRSRLKGATSSEARLKVMLEIYEKFFQKAMPAQVSRLGIVYTPVELVDFILRSADAVLRHEFGRGLTDRGVHILDPFTGTGTFINRLLTQKDNDGNFLIRDEDLVRKFAGTGTSDGVPEIHANEIVLLAYYLAAIKIEEGYRERVGETNYEPFKGIVLTDTFNMMEHRKSLPEMSAMAGNNERADRQAELPIQVIIGNPPWSAGQRSAGDDNPNIEYTHISDRVKDTYTKRYKQLKKRAPGGSSGGNLYIKALRWASDRLSTTSPGMLAFVHPNSLVEGVSLAGVRASLLDEFSSLYVVDLRGDMYTRGDMQKLEGANVFDRSIGGVAMTLLVRNPNTDQNTLAVLKYIEAPTRSDLSNKLAWLLDLGDVLNHRFTTVPVNEDHDWRNLTDGTFKDFLAVCSTEKKATRIGVMKHASGIKTNCDAYVYSFTRGALVKRVQRLISAFNDALDNYLNEQCSIDIVTSNDNLQYIKWTGTLKKTLEKKKRLVFDESRIREVMYRPFTKLWLYEDHRILSSVKTISAMFPRDTSEHTHTHTHTHTHILSRCQQPQNFTSLAINCFHKIRTARTTQLSESILRVRS